MPYIIAPRSPANYQITFDDLLNGTTHLYNAKDTQDTVTVFRDTVPEKLLSRIDVGLMYSALVGFNDKYADLINMENKSKLYHRFCIPKKSGGLRQIDAPLDELMTALRELKLLFESILLARYHYHTSAFAYVRGRSALDATKRHQANESRWFLKLDFKDFFNNTTIDFVIEQMKTIFPYSSIMEIKSGEQEMRKALSLCFLDGKLPQGTPMSPMLTNIMMIPIDHELAKISREHSPHLCYTRYADDITWSSHFSFMWEKMQNVLEDVLKKYNAPFSINKKKTHYGSSSGRNWILGVMLNKDNNITIGHRKKNHFKIMLHNLHTDYENGILWSVEDIQAFAGLQAYYISVEGESIENIIKSYDLKHGRKTSDIIKEILTP